MNIAATHLVEYAPYPMRNERCAVGILARLPDGTWQAHPAVNLKKARAIDPSCDIQALRGGLHAMAAEIQAHPLALQLYASGVGGISVSPRAGRLTYTDQAEFEHGIQWALAVGVEPTHPVQHRERQPISRLFLDLKNAFGAFGWIAAPGERITGGKIIPRFALSSDEGLVLDFAQQTAEQFVALQAVDYRHNAAAKRVEANAKLLTMGVAPQIVVPGVVRRYSVFAGTNAPEAAAALRLAERTCDDIFVEDDPSDMSRLIDLLSSAMGQPRMPTLRTQH